MEICSATHSFSDVCYQIYMAVVEIWTRKHRQTNILKR